VFPPRPIPASAMKDENLGGLSGGYCGGCVCFFGNPFMNPDTCA